MKYIVFALGGIIGVIIAALILLAETGYLRAYRDPTEAMKPTILPGDCLYVESFSYRFRKPRRGELVIFGVPGILGIPEPKPGEESPTILKRVVGLPGDKLEIRGGRLLVNGNEDSALNALQIAPGPKYLTGDGAIVQVPTDSLFVVGDNSRHSYDSRYWGFLPARNVKGRAVFRYWPMSRFGFL